MTAKTPEIDKAIAATWDIFESNYFLSARGVDTNWALAKLRKEATCADVVSATLANSHNFKVAGEDIQNISNIAIKAKFADVVNATAAHAQTILEKLPYGRARGSFDGRHPFHDPHSYVLRIATEAKSAAAVNVFVHNLDVLSKLVPDSDKLINVVINANSGKEIQNIVAHAHNVEAAKQEANALIDNIIQPSRGAAPHAESVRRSRVPTSADEQIR